MRLPQFVYLAGPLSPCAALAKRLDQDEFRILVCFDEAVEEFRAEFAPQTEFDRVLDVLYMMDPFSVGNAAKHLFDWRRGGEGGDDTAALIAYPLRRISDAAPFMKSTPLRDHLLINLGDPIKSTGTPLPTLAIRHTGNVDADYAALQQEFANQMRAIEEQP